MGRRTIVLLDGIEVDGVPLGAAGRLELLLAVLALRGPRGARRDELVDMLWPLDPPRDPGKALNPLLSRLRRIVGEVTGRGMVRLGETFEVDVLTATGQLGRAEIRAARDPALAHATALAAADALKGSFLAAHDDPWTVAERRRLTARREAALTLATRTGLALGGEALTAAARAATTLVDGEPLRESGVELLMEVLVAQGDDAAALQTYERLRGQLERELGATPGVRLQRRSAHLLQRPSGDGTGSRLELPGLLSRARRNGLAGRDVELAAVQRALDDTAGGGLVVIEGSPGIGKTRLAAEVASQYHQAGAVVLAGAAGDAASAPFTPVVSAVRSAALSVDPSELADRLGPLQTDLARLVPALLRRLPVADVTRMDADPDTGRLRLFEAVAALVSLLDGPAGVLLVVEDGHWLDDSSAQVVAHLLRADDLPRLRVLVTARPAPGPSALSRIRDGAHTVTIAVPPLDLGAVRDLVAQQRPSTASDDVDALADRLLADTGGWPLLVRAVLDTDQRAVDLEQAVGAALAWAGSPSRPLIDAMAADGGGAGLDILAAACGMSRADAAGAVDRARDAGLLVSGDDGALAGAMHSAVRDTIMLTLGEGRRAALHAALAEAYEEVHGADADLFAAQIGAHWARADGPACARRGARYEEVAALQALHALAFEQAADHARAARNLGDRAGALADEDRLLLLLLEGEALNRASALESARGALGEALPIALRLGRGDLVARVALEQGGHRLAAGIEDAALVEGLEQALPLVPPDDPGLLARVQGRLAASLLFGAVERRTALAEEAVDLARAAGDDEALAETLVWRHVTELHVARPDKRRLLVDEAERCARCSGRLDLALHARMLRFSDLLEEGEFERARQESATWAAEAAQAHVAYHRWAAEICSATLGLLDGDLDAVERTISRAAELGTALGNDPVVIAAQSSQSFSLLIARGQEALAADAIDVVLSGGHSAAPAFAAALSWCRAVAGEDLAAQELLSSAIAAGLGTMVDPNRLPALSLLVESGVRIGAPAKQLLALHDALATHTGKVVVQHYGGAVHGPVDVRLALLDTALGRTADAQRHLASAELLLGPTPLPALSFDLAHARVRLARRQGDSGAADDIAAPAVAAAKALGLHGVARRLTAATEAN